MHHPDHEMPEFVMWMCREHHMAWHRHWRHTTLNNFIEWVGVARACDDVRQLEEMAIPIVVPEINSGPKKIAHI